MTIKWLGHSCFLMTTDKGTRILCDPCDAATGYEIAPQECDILTISHDHHDHNYAALALGNPVRIDKSGEYRAGDVRISGISTYHDHDGGKKRGNNIVFIFEFDGMRIAHMGDIGEVPDEATMARMGRIDVMLIPVGGVYTIDGEEAETIVEAIKPKVVIPMHYKTPALKFELNELGDCIKLIKDRPVHYMRSSTAHLSADTLGSDRVIVLDYSKE